MNTTVPGLRVSAQAENAFRVVAGSEWRICPSVGLYATPAEDIFRRAVVNGYILIRADMGFGNILSFPLGSHRGGPNP